MKTRTRRRPSTRSDDQEAIVCATARTIKPSASRLIAMMAALTPDAGASHMQLTKLKATTAAQISACHHRSLNASSNSARVNSQNTTTLPVDSAITGACAAATGDVAPIDAVTACAADPSAKAAANLPASTVPKPRNSDAASTSSSATVAPRKAMSMVESIIRSGPFARSSAHRQSNASRRVVQFAWISLSTSPATSPSAHWSCRINQLRHPSARPAAARRSWTVRYWLRCNG